MVLKSPVRDKLGKRGLSSKPFMSTKKENSSKVVLCLGCNLSDASKNGSSSRS